MAVNIGPKIGIDGEKEYRKEIQNIIQQGKTLAAETNATAAAFANANDKEKAAADISKKLNEQIENQRKLVEKLEDAVKKSGEKTGENSDQTLKWKEQLAKAKTELSGLESKAKGVTGEVKDLGEAEADAGEKASVFGDMLKANLFGTVIIAGLKATARIVKDIAQGCVDAVKGAAEYADEINTINKTTGMSTKTIQEWKYAAKLLDIEFETIESSQTKLTKNMDAARDGSKKQAQAFADLGIEIVDADGKLRDSNEVFDEVIDKLRKIENPTERDAVAMDILGKSAKDLNPLIETSADELEDLKKEAHDVGAVMDNDTLNKLNEVQDGFDRLGLSWDALKRMLGANVGIKILPDLQRLVDIFRDFAKTGDFNKFTDSILKGISRIAQKAPSVIRKLLKKLPQWLNQIAASDVWDDFSDAIGETLADTFINAPAIIKAGLELIGAIIRGAIMAIPKMIMRIDEGLKGLDDVTNEHVEAVREKIAEIPDVLSDVQRNLDDIDGKQREAEHWIEIFDELSKKTDPTASDTERLQSAVDHLNTLFPELGLSIDENTGKWSLNTDEIRNNIQALADREKAEAYNEAAGKRYADIVELERERDSLKSELEELEGKITEKSARAGELQAQVDTVKDLQQQFRDGKISVDEYKKSISDLGLGLQGSVGEMDVYGEKVDLMDADLASLNSQLVNVNSEIDNLEKEKKPLTEGIGEVEKAIGDLNEEIEYFYGKASDLANPIEQSVEDAKTGVSKQGEIIGEELDNGIERGIWKGSPRVLSAAERLIKDTINTMREEGQIHSPSKVTENLIGKNLGLGIVKGYEDVIEAAKTRQIFSMTPIFESMTAGGSTTTNTTTNNRTMNLGGLTVNVYPSEGMNIDELTDSMMYKIQHAVEEEGAVFSNELHIQRA